MNKVFVISKWKKRKVVVNRKQINSNGKKKSNNHNKYDFILVCVSIFLASL